MTLINCPFCASDEVKAVLEGVWAVCCAKCGTSGPYKGTQERCETAWNQRIIIGTCPSCKSDTENHNEDGEDTACDECIEINSPENLAYQRKTDFYRNGPHI